MNHCNSTMYYPIIMSQAIYEYCLAVKILAAIFLCTYVHVIYWYDNLCLSYPSCARGGSSVTGGSAFCSTTSSSVSVSLSPASFSSVQTSHNALSVHPCQWSTPQYHHRHCCRHCEMCCKANAITKRLQVYYSVGASNTTDNNLKANSSEKIESPKL